MKNSLQRYLRSIVSRRQSSVAGNESAVTVDEGESGCNVPSSASKIETESSRVAHIDRISSLECEPHDDPISIILPAKRENERTISLTDMPADVILCIVSFLDAQSVCQLASSSKYLRDICKSHSVWRSLLVESKLRCMVQSKACAKFIHPQAYKKLVTSPPRDDYNVLSSFRPPRPWVYISCFWGKERKRKCHARDCNHRNRGNHTHSSSKSSLASKFSKRFGRDRPLPTNVPTAVVVMCGLQDVGKRTIVCRLRLDLLPDPTVNMDVRMCVRIWQVDAHYPSPEMKATFERFQERVFYRVHAVVFVVDASRPETVDDARIALESVRDKPYCKDALFLILANKQDVPGCLSCKELCDRLHLWNWTTNKWSIIPTCTVCGGGLRESVQWLQSNLGVPEMKLPILKGDHTDLDLPVFLQ